MSGITVTSIYHYPVKGLSPQPLDEVTLQPESYFPDDRLYALENGPSGYDPAAPVHLPKIKFLMLMRNATLARLKTRYDPATRHLTITLDEEQLCDSDLSGPEGRAEVEEVLANHCGNEVKGPVRLLEAGEGYRFTDSPRGFVSLLNQASVRAIEEVAGRPVEPTRFRANLNIDGLDAWAEHTLVDARLRVGEALLQVSATTERCAATGVDPATGDRDMNVVRTLLQEFGHNLCGVYARVLEGGRICTGDLVTLAS